MSGPDSKCAAALLAAAERDLLTVRSMSAAAPVESVGFHLQQATEKALKAWLAWLGATYPLTRNLEALMRLLADLGSDPREFEHLTDLTPYAVEFRCAAADDEAAVLDMADMQWGVAGLLARVGRLRDADATGQEGLTAGSKRTESDCMNW